MKNEAKNSLLFVAVLVFVSTLLYGQNSDDQWFKSATQKAHENYEKNKASERLQAPQQTPLYPNGREEQNNGYVVIIVVAVLFVMALILMTAKNDNETDEPKKNEGMLERYSILIKNIMSGDKRTKIENISTDSVLLVLSNAGGTTSILLLQAFGKLVFQWKVQSPIFGDHKKEWSFPELFDQQQMFDKISSDLEQFHLTMLAKR